MFVAVGAYITPNGTFEKEAQKLENWKENPVISNYLIICLLLKNKRGAAGFSFTEVNLQG